MRRRRFMTIQPRATTRGRRVLRPGRHLVRPRSSLPDDIAFEKKPGSAPTTIH